MFVRTRIPRFFSPVIIALILLGIPSMSTAQNSVTKVPDLNGDGISDLIWFNATTGQSVAWLMNGTSVSTSASLPSEANWKIAAAVDFNGDGMTDLLWHNASNGQLIEWLMNGTSITSSTLLLDDPLWKVSEAADLNGDGMSDLILYNASTAQTVAWLLNGTTISSWSLLRTDPDFKVIAAADFNGDGMSDLLLYNEYTGQTASWLMNGTAQLSGATLATDPNWKVAATADFNLDKMADIVWYNAATGETALWMMNGTASTSRVTLQTDLNWKITTTGDLNGDGKADLLWFNSATGQTASWLMNGTGILSNTTLQTNLNWKINAIADLNGDKKSDLLWYNPATGQTAVWLMDGSVGTSGANLFTDPVWRLQCVKTSSLTSVLACSDAIANASTGSTPMPPNQSPVVNAGADQSITLPAVADLSGTVSDDGIPIGLVTVRWSVISGPGSVVFGNATAVNTTATFSSAGTYTLRLTATDSQLSASNNVVIVVSSTSTSNWKKNQAPAVDAGPDQTITLPATANLQGSVVDDGLPYKRLTSSWSKVRGSGTVTFADGRSLSTTAAFSSPGSYTLRLTATDGAYYRNDDVVVIVEAPSAANQPPVVNAGADQMITLPAAANLSGTATDDGLPTGSTLIKTWSKVNGAGVVTFGDASSLNTTATFSVAGTYTLRLTASDGKATKVDDMIVVVSASSSTNKAPVVNAGPDQAVTLPAGPVLSGTATDDGLPAGSTVSVTWTKVSGPGTVVFVNVNSLNASAAIQIAGTYTLRLTATDGTLSSSNDVVVTVNAVAQSNAAPVVNAGSDQTITLPSAASLSGTATDDGLPTGSTLSRTWSMVNGPGNVTFASASAASTTATFSAAGSYTLRLSATDGALSASDDVIINVNATLPANQAPVVNAGPDFTITYPNGITLAGFATDDGLPTGSTLTKLWSKVGGPGTVTFGNAAALNSTANFSTVGTYTLRLTASDSLLSTSDDVIFVVNSAPVVNQPPVVNAGPDSTITLPNGASLAGTATDDGMPTGSTLTFTWSKVSGPGTVTFSNAAALNSTANFSAAGTYSLRLTATDSLLSTSDDVTITSNASGSTAQFYYVDQTSGNDANNGSEGAPWKNAPGMTACSSVCAVTIINPGTKIYFDRADTWPVSGQYGIHVKGGVSYIGDEWGSGNGKAIIRAGSALAAAVIDFREDNPTIPTIVKGFDVDANGTVTNGVGFNFPFYTGPLTGATKRVENLNVHNTWSRTSQGQVTWGVIVSNHGGSQATVKNVEILNSVVHDTSRDGIALFPGDENANCIIQNILVRGNEVYNTGQDPDNSAGSGIALTGRVIDAIIENNYVHDSPKFNLIFVTGTGTHFGFGPTNIHIRYNVLNANNIGQSAILVYDGSNGNDPKDLKIYGNIVYAATYNSGTLGGLWLDSGLGNSNTLLVYNNTFYNAPVTVNNSSATFPTFEFKNNIVYQTTGTAITGSNRFTAASNNITTNPSFKNVANAPTGFSGVLGVDLAPNTDGFSVLSGSPARDTGTALAATYNLSINSLARPQGSAWDIGAYESTASGSGTNAAPAVNAGPDFTITLPNGITLAGSATDDGLPTGSTLTKTWSKVSGPGTVTFGNATALNSTANFSAAGTYNLRLTASDSLLSTFDDVVFTVNAAAPVNQAPVVNAGLDFTLTLPIVATLAGSATDDGLPTGSTLTKTWSQLGGPGTVTFGNATALNSTANFSAAGTYTLRLTASDSLLSTSDDVVIVVNAPSPSNQAPVVNAGSDLTITLPSGVTLAGSATDDGLPTGSTLTKSWSKVGGPGTVTFGNATALNSTANFSVAGTYTLRLMASDSLLSTSDDVVFTVNAAPPVNQAPVVNAGSDLTITLPSGVTLAGSATDDGLPTGSTLTKSWSKVGGPGTVTFGNATALNSTANFSVAGTYTLRLTASDSLLSTSDDVVFIVNAAPPVNQAPVVSAGPDRTVTFPTAATLSGTATDDGLPSGSTTKSWSKVSGPGTVVFVNSTSLSASATFSTAGTYTLRLTVSDGALQSSDDMVVVVNPCGTIVSGNITVMANASDNVGVTSVEMKLDGVIIGSADTTAPYAFTWNTLTTTNGCHVVSVVAKDAAGNQGTASASTQVNNP